MTEAHDDAELIKTLRMNELFDFYGDLLTAKQRRYIELYYADDLSLGEIAEEFSVSRQAVYDNIRRTGKLLEEYEAKLHLLAQYTGLDDAATALQQYAAVHYPTDTQLQTLVTALQQHLAR
ncbi:putative DNA-binding protein [Schleiferilactobacillus harbinensis]|jgi:predicted DNA-binding protein YlxM (UPF0122 family)|uniref:UPF0122 protein D1010_10465 n=1 Tax=Schleiferilactobacillus harbinensis TaxID=304207 RepID=A0A510TRG7_9LACO|nr:putative DNA-binding protein [Schleiferilactobacillus harbinensis]HAY52420.1 putative DNA-binding protein [Lactobacillus sp.]MCI1687760.1 putative DNA-binding protein [Schleiferilactobacillus harbinensis]MCI1782293.1 putative DNA-binding protein [Schleiferilactobacillus harbinensis]MCI1850160.1 putative DNA-binding protein [Schleiferilactobacillus harbinensis]MCT2909063.1 putative DNA-binding protein [Schleiferilactobacillus harbinensis]